MFNNTMTANWNINNIHVTSPSTAIMNCSDVLLKLDHSHADTDVLTQQTIVDFSVVTQATFTQALSLDNFRREPENVQTLFEFLSLAYVSLFNQYFFEE